MLQVQAKFVTVKGQARQEQVVDPQPVVADSNPVCLPAASSRSDSNVSDDVSSVSDTESVSPQVVVDVKNVFPREVVDESQSWAKVTDEASVENDELSLGNKGTVEGIKQLEVDQESVEVDKAFDD